MYMNFPSENPFTRNHLVRPSYISNSHVEPPYYPESLIGIPKQYHHHNLNIWNYHDSRASSKINILDKSRINQSELTSFGKNIAVGRKDFYDGGSNRFRESRILSNPFLRKSLIAPQEKLVEELEFDLSMIGFKNRAETGRVSFGTPNETPYRYPDSLEKSRSKSFQDSPFKVISKPEESFPESRVADRMVDRVAEKVIERIGFKSHENFKSEIKVRGEKFYRANVMAYKH